MAASKSALIMDFDNTLYDWFHMWYQSFSAMLSEVVRISGISEDVLTAEIRAVHQKFGTSEYAFLLENIPSLQSRFPGQKIPEVFDDAIHAYRRARNENLRLYDGVKETLTALKSSGILIALYTDSRAFYTVDRIRRLELDDLVDFLFSPPDHEIPDSITRHTQRDKYRLTHCQHRYLPEGDIKPSPKVLLDILSDVGHAPEDSVYVGDSLMRDVAMAQDAGVLDVYAEYGVVQNHPGYPLLRKVSHWTDVDVEREKKTSKRTVIPSHTISQFSEIKNFFLK